MHKIPIRTLFLLFTVIFAIIVSFLLFGEGIEAWTESLIERTRNHPLQIGVLVIFLLMIDVVVPIPSSLVITAGGMILGVAAGVLASLIGLTGTVLIGYLIGRYAARPAEKLIGAREVEIMHVFQRRFGLWLLLAMRPVPILAEASVLFSGILRQPVIPVFAVTGLGNLVVSVLFVSVGLWGRESDAFLLSFAISILLTALLMAIAQWRIRRVTNRVG